MREEGCGSPSGEDLLAVAPLAFGLFDLGAVGGEHAIERGDDRRLQVAGVLHPRQVDIVGASRVELCCAFTAV